MAKKVLNKSTDNIKKSSSSPVTKKAGLFGLFRGKETKAGEKAVKTASRSEGPKKVATKGTMPAERGQSMDTRKAHSTQKVRSTSNSEVMGFESEPAKAAKNPHARPKASDIQKNYTQISDHQLVFMYMMPGLFGNSQKYYNKEFDNIDIVGTSAVESLWETFSKKTACNALLLFIFNQREVEYIYDFLKRIGFNHLDRRMLNINIVPRDGIDISKIVNDKELAKFISKTEPIRLDKEHNLTTLILDRAITPIVQNQPVYTIDREIVKPQKVGEMESSISKIFNVDVVKIQAQVNMLKSQDANKERLKQVKQAVLAAKSTEELDNAVNGIPEIALLKDVEKQLDANIDKFNRKDYLRKDAEKLIQNRFLISALKNAELKNIVDQVVAESSRKLDDYDRMREDINKHALDELSEANTGNEKSVILDKLHNKRLEAINAVKRSCAEYKTFVQLINNFYTLSSNTKISTCNYLCELLGNSDVSLSAESRSTIADYAKKLKLQVQLDQKNQNKVEQRFEDMLSYQREVFKNFGALVKIDDSIIKLQQEIITDQKANIEVKRYTDSKFQTIGVNILALEGAGVNTIFNAISDEDDLFVFLDDTGRGCDITENLVTLEDFLDTNWEISKSPVIYIGTDTLLNELNTKKQLNRFFSKLEYVSRSYKHVYIINYIDIDLEEIQNKVFLESIEQIGNIIFFVKPDNEMAVSVNAINNNLQQQIPTDKIYLKRIIVNQITKEFKTEKKRFMQLCGVNLKSISIPYMKALETCQSMDKVRKALEPLKIYISR